MISEEYIIENHCKELCPFYEETLECNSSKRCPYYKLLFKENEENKEFWLVDKKKKFNRTE